MIKEAYVSFELALLLEEKGFYGQCHNFVEIEDMSYGEKWNKKSQKTLSIPTQQMTMRWLREEKNILIFIVPAKDESGNLQYMADVWTWVENEGLYETTWCTAEYVYEKAVEAALIYCLENLIKED